VGRYLGGGWLQISVANAIVVGLMVLGFVAALLLPFPGSGAQASRPVTGDRGDRSSRGSRS